MSKVPATKPEPKTHCTLEELCAVVYPKPGENGRIIGDRMNRAQIAEAFGVSLPTVDSWVRRGCPVAIRTGREIIFDHLRVQNWKINRDVNGERAKDFTRQQLLKDLESLQARILSWFHMDASRAEDPNLCMVGHALNGAAHFLSRPDGAPLDDGQ